MRRERPGRHRIQRAGDEQGVVLAMTQSSLGIEADDAFGHMRQ